jgi:hypothetical protein
LNLDKFCKTVENNFENLKKIQKEKEQHFQQELLKLEKNLNNNKNELDLEMIKYKNEMIKSFEKFENKNKNKNLLEIDSKITEVEQKLKLIQKNQEISNDNNNEYFSRFKDIEKDFEKIIMINEKVGANEKKIKKIKEKLKEIQKKEKVENDNNANFKELLNNVKIDFFGKMQSLKKELKYKEVNNLESKIKSKNDLNKKKGQSSIEDLDGYNLKKINDLEKAIKQNQNEIKEIKLKIETAKKLEIEKNVKSPVSSDFEKKDLTIKKTDFNKICEYLDEKANIKDVNDLIKEMYNEIDKMGEIKKIKNDMNLKSVQFIWKSGETFANKIPWEIECFNNQKNNFILSKNRYEIIIMDEGLYEISFGIFGRVKPKFKMFLNGENIVSSVNMKINDSFDKFENKHSNGNVVGLTLYDFFVFPFNSHIWFEFGGSIGYEGFIKISKM